VQPITEETKSPIQYTPIGEEPLLVNPDDTEIHFIKFRIPKIARLDVCLKLQVYN
jgi:hypothetical protein